MFDVQKPLRAFPVKRGLLISGLTVLLSACTATDATDPAASSSEASLPIASTPIASTPIASSQPAVSSSQAVISSASAGQSSQVTESSQSSNSSASASVVPVPVSSAPASSSIASSSVTSASSAPAIQWQHCADEKSVCYFNGASQVRFGAQDQWVVVDVSGSIACQSSNFGGDPLQGVRKTCQVPVTTTVKEPPQSSSSSSSQAPAVEWKHCADGQEVCYFEGRSRVRFGAKGEWLTKTATDSIACNTRAFGGDPLPNAKKTCQVPKGTTVKAAPRPPVASGELEPLSTAKVVFSRRLVAKSHVSDGTDYQRGGKREFAGPMGANAVSYNGYQYVVFYSGKDRSKANSKAKVQVGRRQIAGGNWEFTTLKNYSLSSEDGHNRPIIAISKGDGVIHIGFDHHATPQFNYAKTKVGVADSPESVTWNNDVFKYQKNAGLGNNVFNQGLTRVTYPIFTSLDSGNLILYFRGGSSNNGAMIVGKYDATDHKWKFTKTFSSPKGNYKGNTKTRSPYTSRGIQVNADGDLQVTWVWREFLGTKGCHQSSRNFKNCTHGLYFAKSSNEGTTWQNNDNKTVANINSKNLIGIGNIDGPVVDIPGSLEPTNVGNTSAIDPKTGDMHVMLLHKKRASDSKPVIHHYIGTPKGKWTGGPSSFSANGAAIRFVGDYAVALIDRSKAQVFVAKRSEKFQTWREIKIPKLPVSNNKKESATGGFITWDTSRLDKEGIASILWHFTSPNLLKGEPSAIWTYDIQLMEK